MIDLTAIATRITIGGQNLSPQQASIVVSDDYVTESGLVATKGSVELHEGALSIDDWAGLSWLRPGTPVVAEIDLGSGWVRHPRGALVVTGTAYDEKQGRNTIEVACPIGARLGKGAFDERLVTGTTAQAAITQLFELAGVGTPNWGSVTENYNLYTRPKLQNSYLATAGEILGDMCLFAYVDGSGTVRIVPVDGPIIITAARSTFAGAKRVLVGNQPSNKAKVSANYRQSTARSNTRTKPPVVVIGDIGAIVPGAAGDGVVSRVTSTDTINVPDKIISTLTVDERLGFQVFKGRSGYPRSTPVQNRREQTITIYSTGPDTKKLRVVTTVTAPRYVALQSWCDWAIAKGLAPSLSVDTTILRRVETLIYNDREQLIRHTATSEEPIGLVLASFGNIDWQVIYDAFGVPDDPTLSERLTVTYTEVTPGEWSKLTTKEYAQCRDSAGQQGLQQRAEEALPSELIGIYRDAANCSAAEITPEDSTSGQVTPPAPERFPFDFGVEDRGFDTEVAFDGFDSGWLTQPQTYNCNYCPDILAGETAPIDFAQRYGQTWHGVALQRYQSIQLEMPFRSELLNYRPYARIRVNGPDYDYVVAMNGTTWGIQPNKAIVSTDASLVGRFTGSVIVPPFRPRLEASLVLALQLDMEILPFARRDTMNLELALDLQVSDPTPPEDPPTPVSLYSEFFLEIDSQHFS